MSALPPLTAVTRPELDTVATAVFDDCQLACDVTLCVVPFDNVAVAVNCAVAPTVGTVPATESDATVGAGVGVDTVGEPPQAPMMAPTSTVSPKTPIGDRNKARLHFRTRRRVSLTGDMPRNRLFVCTSGASMPRHHCDGSAPPVCRKSGTHT